MRPLYPILSARCGVLDSVRALVAIPLLLLFTAAPAQADVVMDPLKPCYVSDGELVSQRERIDVHAWGFAPLAALTLQIDGNTEATPISGAFGEVRGSVSAPFEELDEHEFTLTIFENQNPAQHFASRTALVTNLAVKLRPRRAQPSRKVRFSGRGFTAAAPVYGHYLFGDRLRRTVRFVANSHLPCGTFHARRRQIPIKNPAVGQWIVQVDQQKHYSPHPATNMQRVIIRVRQGAKQP
jgi:hypothetical protein